MFYFNHNLSSEIPFFVVPIAIAGDGWSFTAIRPRHVWGGAMVIFFLTCSPEGRNQRGDVVEWRLKESTRLTKARFVHSTWRFKHPHLQVPVSNIHFGPCARIGCMEHKAACFSEQSMPCALEFHVQVVRAPALYKRSWWTKQAASGRGKQCSMETKLLSPPNSISLIINFHPKAH